MTERPYKLPSRWRWVKLEEVCEIIMGQSPPSKTYNDIGEGLPFFQGKADFGEIYPIPRVWCISPQKVAQSGDVLISVRAPVGPTNLAKELCCIGRGLAALRPNSGLDKMWLLYYLRNAETEISSYGKGSAFTAITKKHLVELLIPLPPLDEQRGIVEMLETLMERVREARRLRAEARQDTDRLMQVALAEVFPSPESSIPNNWQWVKLEEVCEINPRRPLLNRENSLPTSFVPMNALDEVTGTIVDMQVRPYSEVKRGYTYFEEGDVIFAKITPCMENGKAAIAHGLIDGVGFGSTEFHVLRPQAKVAAEWIWFFVRQERFRQEAKEAFRGAVGQQRVPQEFLESYLISFPPLEEQRHLVAYLDHVQAKVVALKRAQEETGRELHRLQQAILDRAFRGEL